MSAYIHKYFKNAGWDEIDKRYFSGEKIRQRLPQKTPTFETLANRINDLYKEIAIIKAVYTNQ